MTDWEKHLEQDTKKRLEHYESLLKSATLSPIVRMNLQVAVENLRKQLGL